MRRRRKYIPPLGENAYRVKRLIQADPELPIRDIADALGLTTQRIYQIIDTLERRGELQESA